MFNTGFLTKFLISWTYKVASITASAFLSDTRDNKHHKPTRLKATKSSTYLKIQNINEKSLYSVSGEVVTEQRPAVPWCPYPSHTRTHTHAGTSHRLEGNSSAQCYWVQSTTHKNMIKSFVISWSELSDDITRVLCLLTSANFLINCKYDAIFWRFPTHIKYWCVLMLTWPQYFCSVWKVLYKKSH